MAFETGVSTSPTDLLAKIETRANTDGWTIVRNNGLAETGSSDQLSISDGLAAEAIQFNFVAYNAAAVARIEMQPSTGDSGASQPFYNHTGTPDGGDGAGSHLNFGNAHNSAADQGFSGGSIAYFLFSSSTADGRYMHVVLEGTSGVYWHMLFGTILKAGTLTGGQYAAASLTSSSTTVLWPFQFAPPAASGTQWIRFDNFKSSGSPGWRELNGFLGNIGTTSPLLGVFGGGLTEIAQRTPFAPMIVPYWETENPTVFTTANVVAGHLPDVMMVSMDGREPGEVITLGSDDWHLFPVHRKTSDGVSSTTSAYINTHVVGPAPAHDSNLMGIAYREIP